MEEGRAVLATTGPSDSSILQAQHLERIQNEFAAGRLPTRGALLKGQGEDPNRPAVESPMLWKVVTSMSEAVAFAQKEARPLLVEFTALDCGWCRFLTHITYPDEEVDGLLRRFACVKFISNFDSQKEFEGFGVTGFPSTVALTTQGKVLGKSSGFSPPSKYASKLASWIELAGR